MAFKLVPNPTFKASVNLTVPGQAGPSQIEVEFRYNMPQSLLDLIELDRPLDSFLARAARWLNIWWRLAMRRPFPQADGILREVIVGWDGVNDAEDKPLAYRPELLDTLFAGYPAAARQLLYGYLAGRVEAREKN